MFATLRRRFASLARRVTAFSALTGFLIGITGVPVLRFTSPGKDRSTPFPCQDHKCGCASAEQCWRSCCCFTNREKLTWANKHGVTPPAFVLAAAEREQPVAKCCSAKQVANCCQSKSSCCDHDSNKRKVDAPRITFDFVSAIQARKCHGQAEQWMALGAVTMPPAKIALVIETRMCGLASVVIPTLTGVSSSPETPPPRA